MGVIYAVKGINATNAFYGINTQYAVSGILDGPQALGLGYLMGTHLALEVVVPFFKGL
jgi:hypothetical protein